MKISLFLAFLLTVASAFAADAMKFVSPDKSTTLVVDKSGKRDIIELQSGKRVHRLVYEDLASDHKCLRLSDLCKELEISSARAYCSGAGAASQDGRLFGAFVPVS
jgi:hypothetical protein